jgi:hypothetical protein
MASSQLAPIVPHTDEKNMNFKTKTPYFSPSLRKEKPTNSEEIVGARVVMPHERSV